EAGLGESAGDCKPARRLPFAYRFLGNRRSRAVANGPSDAVRVAFIPRGERFHAASLRGDQRLLLSVSDAPHPNAEIFGNGSRFCDATDDPIDVPAVSMVWTACQKVRWTNSACCWSLGCCNWLHYVCKSTLRRQLLENLLSSF